MNNETTFDLEAAIVEWRKPYEAQRRYRDSDIEELERHLRDEIEVLMSEGTPAREAFTTAASEVGEAWAGEVEYGKAYWSRMRRPSAGVTEIAWSVSLLLNQLPAYTIQSVRAMLRYKAVTLINIGGLAIGLMCAILAMSFVRYHLGFDTFQPDRDRIYRLLWSTPGEGIVTSSTSGPLAPALKGAFPEVVAATRLDHQSAWVQPESGAYSTRMVVTDPTIFDVFDYVLIEGYPDRVFEKPLSVVITESAARTWFGTADVTGKVLKVESYLKNGDYTITGVLKDPPKNASEPLRAFSLISTTKIGPESDVNDSRREEIRSWWDTWHATASSGSSMETFVKLRSSEDAPALSAKLPGLLEKNLGQAAGNHELILQPLEDIHLYGAHYGLQPQGADLRAVTLVGGIALLILTVACVNFVNLSTARAIVRQKEIGIRKASGALGPDLFVHFIFESILHTGIAGLTGLLLARLAYPVFAEHSGYALPASFLSSNSLPDVALLLLLAGLAAGIYPAYVLSTVHPARALKQKHLGSRQGHARHALATLQFITCILLLLATLVMRGQTHYLMNRDLGFNDALVITMPIFAQDRGRKPTYGNHLSYMWRTVKASALEHPNIIAASAFKDLPGAMDTRMRAVEADGRKMDMPFMTSDAHLLDLLELEVVLGRDFNAETGVRELTRRRENQEFILNESAVRALGWDDPVGKPFNRGPWRYGSVVGVVKDFHFRDLREPIRPLVIFYSVHSASYLGVRVLPDGIDETINHLKTVWEKFLPERPFQFAFLDEEIDQAYRRERQTSTLMNDFAILGILLGCMGLFGLTSFAVERRVREIGIRKSLGAGILDIVYRLLSESGGILVAANLIAWPIGFYLLQQWLSQFVYRIDLHAGYFIMSGLAAAVVAFLTVSLQAVPAARANPVDSLRHE